MLMQGVGRELRSGGRSTVRVSVVHEKGDLIATAVTLISKELHGIRLITERWSVSQRCYWQGESLASSACLQEKMSAPMAGGWRSYASPTLPIFFFVGTFQADYRTTAGRRRSVTRAVEK